MPKINVYLPSELAAAVRAAGLPVSPICQQALAEAVRRVGLTRQLIEAIRAPGTDPSPLVERSIGADQRITLRVKAALDGAQVLGRDAGCVATTHLLVGLIDQGDNLAVRLLRALGVDVDDLRETAAHLGDEPPGGEVTAGEVTAGQAAEGEAVAGEAVAGEAVAVSGAGRRARPSPPGPGSSIWAMLTPAGREAIAATFEATIELAHSYVGCEHLLLGLVADASSGAGRALRAFGVVPGDARRAVTSALAGFVQATEGAGAVSPRQLGEIVRRLEAVERRLEAVERRLGATGP